MLETFQEGWAGSCRHAGAYLSSEPHTKSSTPRLFEPCNRSQNLKKECLSPQIPGIGSRHRSTDFLVPIASLGFYRVLYYEAVINPESLQALMDATLAPRRTESWASEFRWLTRPRGTHVGSSRYGLVPANANDRLSCKPCKCPALGSVTEVLLLQAVPGKPCRRNQRDWRTVQTTPPSCQKELVRM